MSATIYQIPMQVPGMVGVFPNQKFMVCGDSLSAITTAGYLNQVNLESNPMSNTDIVQCLYSYNLQTTSGTYGVFTVSISGTGVITLSAASAESIPSVAGDVASFANTMGGLADSGILATNVMTKNSSNAMAVGSGIVLAKVNGTEATNVVTASGVAGVLTTSSLTTAGAGTYIITWTNTKITATSVITLTIQGGTNTTQNITFTCIPGSGTATLTIYNNTSATSLNGTILIGYTVF
jgi:hypothetical protein